MQIYNMGEIWDGVNGDDLTYLYTKVILRKGNSFFYARTSQRLGSAIKVDELDAIPIPIEDIRPQYHPDLTRVPVPLPVDCYLKYANLLECGSSVGPPPSDLVLAEARICEILSACPHPNIAQYFGCVVEDGRISALCFVEYHSTLADWLQAECQPISRDVCADIERGIQHLHSLGFSHNDINPYNIMFKSDGTAVIIDFDSCARFGVKLVKQGGWNDEIYEYASPANDCSALGKITEIIDSRMRAEPRGQE
jgi:serine/threonine protein kinase